VAVLWGGLPEKEAEGVMEYRSRLEEDARRRRGRREEDEAWRGSHNSRTLV
jgi:hypothetical protein